MGGEDKTSYDRELEKGTKKNLYGDECSVKDWRLNAFNTWCITVAFRQSDNAINILTHCES